MKCQILFSGKKIGKISIVSSAEFAPRAVKINKESRLGDNLCQQFNPGPAEPGLD